MFESATITTTIQSPSYADATASTSMASPPRFDQSQRALGDKSRTSNTTTPESRAELRSQWLKAKRAAAAIAEALRRDPPAAFGPACDLNLALESLWKLRKHRDDDNWVGILDRLQTTLRELGGDGVTSLSESQGRILEDFVHDLLSLSEKSDRQLIEAVRRMDELGVPPYLDFQAFGGDRP